MYLHCPQKKIKGEYCYWCKDWGKEWDERLVFIDKTCYDTPMETTKKPMGRPIDMESLKKAVEYREKGLGLLEVARAVHATTPQGKPVKTENPVG